MRRGYWGGASYFSFLLLIYPIAWAVCEGSNLVSPTGEFIWYGILDLLAGPVFLFGFLSALRGIDYGAFGLTSLKYSEGINGPGVGGGAGPGVGAGTGPGMTARGSGPVTGAGGAGAAPGNAGNVDTAENTTGTTGTAV